jgi:putative transposase
MKGTRRSEEQIIAILKQGEAGVTTAELFRLNGITEQTYYRWKAKYGGKDSGEAKTAKATGRREPEADACGGRTDAG